jgi:peptidoglycan/LPS O-acetylase OafA/YrhL
MYSLLTDSSQRRSSEAVGDSVRGIYTPADQAGTQGPVAVAAAAPAASVTRHIPSLDGLRAISFGLVFAGHAGLNHVVPTVFGVTVFFFLSGYLITTLMRAEFEKTGTVSLRNFFLRRALRILPPFYLVFGLALAGWWAGLLPRPGELASIPAVLLHYANYYIVQYDHLGFLTGTGIYWSLAVEEHFYLLFPFAYLFLTRSLASNRTRAMSLLAVCAAILVWRCVLVFIYDAPMLRTSVASDTRFDSLLFGCALALYGNPATEPSRLSERTWKFVLFPLGMLGLIIGFAVRDEGFRETLRYTIQGLSLVPIFVCAVRYPDWLPIRPLNFRPMMFVGTLSYSLYLLHLIVLGGLSENFGATLSPLMTGLLGLGITFVLAVMMYKAVEQPCARLRRRLHG